MKASAAGVEGLAQKATEPGRVQETEFLLVKVVQARIASSGLVPMLVGASAIRLPWCSGLRRLP
jgi:hypothetical protein